MDSTFKKYSCFYRSEFIQFCTIFSVLIVTFEKCKKKTNNNRVWIKQLFEYLAPPKKRTIKKFNHDDKNVWLKTIKWNRENTLTLHPHEN